LAEQPYVPRDESGQVANPNRTQVSDERETLRNGLSESSGQHADEHGDDRNPTDAA